MGDIIEILGAIFGMIGAVLMAFNNPYSKYGWVFFMGANVCWMTFSINKSMMFLFTQELVFLCINIFGLWRWVIKPIITNRNDKY
jgi:hypothetical protein